MTTVLTAKEVTAGYGELVLVELPAMDCFASLGWEVANLYDETFGVDGTEGRKSSAEVILVPRLRRALERINPATQPPPTSRPSSSSPRTAPSRSR